MFPWIDGFHWTAVHIIFLTLFGLALLTIGSTVLAGLWRTRKEFATKRANQAYWHGIFAALPQAERHCRHQFAGRVAVRVCDNAFDCRTCPNYAKFAESPAKVASMTVGVPYSDRLLYHRGHTWVRPEADGTFVVGLDEFAKHVVGQPDLVELPAAGKELQCEAIAWRMKKNGHEIGVRAPIDGTVVVSDPQGVDWYLKIRPHEPVNVRHLLSGLEVAGWLAAEIDRLQLQLCAPGAPPCLADGGALMPELMDAEPKADWDAVLAGTFLDV